MIQPRTLLFSLALVGIFTTSCSKEDMNDYTHHESDWCVVQGRGSKLCFLADDQEILKPLEPLDSMRFLAGDRYWVYYVPIDTIGALTGTLVQLENYQPVVVKDAVMAGSFSGSINDIIWLNEDPFFGGGFLNMDFSYSRSGPDSEHGIHLLQDSISHRKIYMRFGHNAKGDSPVSTATALISFPISSINYRSVADSLVIRVLETMNAPISYTIALKDTL
jgi:hypothetical protein